MPQSLTSRNLGNNRADYSWRKQFTRLISIRQECPSLRQSRWRLLTPRRETSLRLWTRTSTRRERTTNKLINPNWIHPIPLIWNTEIQNLWLKMAATSKNGQRFSHRINRPSSRKYPSWTRALQRCLEELLKLDRMALHRIKRKQKVHTWATGQQKRSSKNTKGRSPKLQSLLWNTKGLQIQTFWEEMPRSKKLRSTSGKVLDLGVVRGAQAHLNQNLMETAKFKMMEDT